MITINGNSHMEIEQWLNNALRVSRWADLSKLNLCINYMIFGRKMPRNSIISIGANHIKRVKSVKYLGITINEKLTFQEYVVRITEKANNNAYALRCTISRLYRFDNDSFRTSFYAAVLPFITYGSKIF